MSDDRYVNTHPVPPAVISVAVCGHIGAARKAHEPGPADDSTEGGHDLKNIGALFQCFGRSHFSEESVIDLTIRRHQGQGGITIVPQGVISPVALGELQRLFR